MDDEAKPPGATAACPDADLVTALAHGRTVDAGLANHVATCARCSTIAAGGVGATVASGLADAVARPSAQVLAAQVLATGAMVGRYRILERLGHGGMGIVYRAADTELDRQVALKLVRTGRGSLDELTERLRRESRLQARTKHPNVITVHDIGRDGDRVYVAMELARGGTLQEWLKRQPRAWREVVDVFRAAGKGLAAAHAAGLVHRDFKPDNVLVEADGARIARVLVSDFGVARAIEATEYESSAEPSSLLATVPGAVVGTPAYMAPEQLHGRALDARADQFAFAIGLWEGIYGERPFRGNTLGELAAAVMSPPAQPARAKRVPRWLDRVLRKALASEPDARFASMTELLRALDWRRHRRTARLVAGGAVLIGATVVAGLVLRGTEPTSPCAVESGGVAQLRAADARLRGLVLAGRDVQTRDTWAEALDTYAKVAEDMRAETCRASPRPTSWADRVRCLDGAAMVTAATIDAMASSSPERARYALQDQPPAPPVECATDAASAYTRLFASESGPAAAAVAADISVARGLAFTYMPQANAELDRIDERARALRSARLVDLAQLARAELPIEASTFVSPTIVSALRDVAVRADRDGVIDVAAMAWVDLALSAAMGLPSGARDTLAQADAALTRAGDPPRARARWQASWAFLLAEEFSATQAAQHVVQAEEVCARGHIAIEPQLNMLLGDAEVRAGRGDAAQAHYQRALQQLAGLDADDSRATSVRVGYARTLIGGGRFEDGRALLEPMLAVVKEPVSLAMGWTIALIAEADNRLGREPEVEQLAAKWSSALDRDLGAQMTPAAQLVFEHANAAFTLGDFDEAERASATALERYVQSAGAHAYATADVRELRGQVLLKLGRFSDAVTILDEAVKDLVAELGETDTLVVQGRVALADALVGNGKATAALAMIEASYDAYRKLTDPSDGAYADYVLGRALMAVHRDPARARTLLEGALAVWTKDPTGWSPEIAEAKRTLTQLR